MTDAITYEKEHTVEDRSYSVEYNSIETVGHYDKDSRWVRGVDAGIVICWPCGDMIGPWTIEQFEQLLKDINKATYDYPLRVPVASSGWHLVWKKKGSDIICWTDDINPEYDNEGPSLSELRKALRGIKAAVKKEQERGAEA